MKTNIILLMALVLIISACSTGSHVTSSWVDDIYFSPSDIPPAIIAEEKTERVPDQRTKSGERIIISEIRDNDEGSKTMDNYIFDGQDAGNYADAQLYNLDQMELSGSDTTIYYDENEVKYVINNYYDGDDIDFSRRIHRFHRPYFYDPYYFDFYGWDPWYYPYSSFSMSYGWGWGSSWGWPYSSWHYPYSSWYSPYYSYYGWGGGYPYYGGWYGGYYGGYWGHPGYYYNWSYRDSDNIRYGRSSNFANYGSGGGSGTSAIRSAANGRNADGNITSGRSVYDVNASGTQNGRRVSSTESNRIMTEMRRGESANSGRTVVNPDLNTQGSIRNSGTVRSGSSVQGQAPATRRTATGTTQGTYTRPVTNSQSVRSGNNNSYTPSYNQPRTVTRSTYNVQGTTRPSSSNTESVTKSATTPVTTYTRPGSTQSNTVRTYRSTSTYNRSSTSSPVNNSRSVAPSSSPVNRGSYSAPTRSYSPSSSGGSYSSPSRSSSSSGSGSYSSGSSSSGSSGSSGRSSSGGGRR